RDRAQVGTDLAERYRAIAGLDGERLVELAPGEEAELDQRFAELLLRLRLLRLERCAELLVRDDLVRRQVFAELARAQQLLPLERLRDGLGRRDLLLDQELADRLADLAVAHRMRWHEPAQDAAAFGVGHEE